MPDCDENLTAAVLTPPGRGAVAVIRLLAGNEEAIQQLLSGIDRYFHSATGRKLHEQDVGKLCYGYWRAESSSDSEDVVVCRTEEKTTEVSCHGGPAATRRILDCLKDDGFQVVDWPDQEARATTPLQAEFDQALSQARTSRTASMLHRQASGLFRTELEYLLEKVSKDSAAVIEQVESLLHWTQFGIHLVEPWRVVLAGCPNVGKSTLINALLGYQRAIVFDQPGTTRDVVTGLTAFEGWPIELSDTAGIRGTSDALEQAGISRTKKALAGADLVCFLFDRSQPAERDEERQMNEVIAAATNSKTPCLFIDHKSDLTTVRQILDLSPMVAVSSVTGEGVDCLAQRMIELLIPELPEEQQPFPVTRRQVTWLRSAVEELRNANWNEGQAALQKCMDGISIEDNRVE